MGRDHMESYTGQRLYAAIGFEDGTWYREESGRIRDGRLRANPG